MKSHLLNERGGVRWTAQHHVVPVFQAQPLSFQGEFSHVELGGYDHVWLREHLVGLSCLQCNLYLLEFVVKCRSEI